MRFFKGQFVFSPSDLVTFFESEFSSYMDHFIKAVSKERQKELGVYPDPADPLFEIIAQMGAQHEKEVIKTHSILKIDRGPTSLQKTLSAMKGGAPAIYQGAISANSSKNKISA